MKVKKAISYILLIILVIQLVNCSNNKLKNLLREDDDEDGEDDSIVDPDKTLGRIRDYIWEIADNMANKNKNLLVKKLNLGILPDEYPINMKEKAKLVRKDRTMWNQVMLYPTAVWRMCIFPNFKINYVQWCTNKLAYLKTRTKLNGKE